MASAPRQSWNLRVSSADQDLIDRAVAASGLTRTDFVLQAARHAARELLVDQAWLTLSPERLEQFLNSLDAPPLPNERLRRTMASPRPWRT